MKKWILLIFGLSVLIFLVFAFFSDHPDDFLKGEYDFSSDPVENDGVYEINMAESSIIWEGYKTLIADFVNTGFINSTSSSTITIEKGGPKSANILIDMNTIRTKGVAEGKEDKLAEHLKSADFFESAKYPVSTFSLTEATVEPNKDNSFIIRGNLKIKDITNPIEFDAQLYKAPGGKIKAVGTMIIDRTKYGITYGSGSFFKNLGDKVIDDDFKLIFDLTLTHSN
jgi:polyisoprenoid-binding protein YceI